MGRGQGWGVDRKQVGASFLGVELHKHEKLRYGWTKFYRLDEFVSYSKTNTVLPGFVLAFTVPKECVFLLFEASKTSKAGFLQGCNVDIQPSQLLIMAVLRGPSVFRMSVNSPVSIVRTFQLPRVRVCLFLFNPFFLREIAAVHLSVCFQTSVQLTLAEQADCGGKHLIDWGLPSLSGR